MSNENFLESMRNKTERYYGFYRGIVRNSFDPDEKGRVKVEVLPMMKDIEVANLPWAMPKFPMEWTMIPAEGSTVWVFFEQGNVYKPVYEASTLPIKNQGLGDGNYENKDNQVGDPIHHASVASNARNDAGVSASPEYPYLSVFASPGGIVIEVDDTPGAERLHFYHPSGASIHIDKNGKVRIKSEQIMEVVGDGIDLDGGVLKVDGTQVVKEQQSPVTIASLSGGDKVNKANIQKALNDIVSRMQAHGLIG